MCTLMKPLVKAHDEREKMWVENDDVSGGTKDGIHNPTSKGSRLIILYAGSENVWIEETDLVCQSKSQLRITMMK